MSKKTRILCMLVSGWLLFYFTCNIYTEKLCICMYVILKRNTAHITNLQDLAFNFVNIINITIILLLLRNCICLLLTELNIFVSPPQRQQWILP